MEIFSELRISYQVGTYSLRHPSCSHGGRSSSPRVLKQLRKQADSTAPPMDATLAISVNHRSLSSDTLGWLQRASSSNEAHQTRIMAVCTKLVQWLAAGGLFLVLWYSLVAGLLPIQLSVEVYDVIVPVSPESCTL